MLKKLVVAIGLSATALSGFAATMAWLPEIIVNSRPGRYADSAIAASSSTQADETTIEQQTSTEDDASADENDSTF